MDAEEAEAIKNSEERDNTDIQKNTASRKESVMQKTVGSGKKPADRKLKAETIGLYQAEKKEKTRRTASKPKKAKPSTPEQEAERLLKSVDRFMSGRRKVWSGSATELASLLKGAAISPYAITRKLHENEEQLQVRYGITIDSGRDRDRRILILMRNTNAARKGTETGPEPEKAAGAVQPVDPASTAGGSKG